ncbi:hypothetical protein A1122_19650 [Yersinia pestis A1122]|nr:hypothetical protein A1122_19650 [Yersinia pestis A1122]EKS46830.1 hypothetical protein INS_05960 [Yersinia pestis INS]ERP75937.1 hypothetical protein L327_05735 [Yersinia pestis S3]ERP76653.1 hypothetical protein L328_05720 [Yersinia pestis 24H]ERP77474.1 hypothetical protein L326_05695 [Yersinia pestis 113]ERP83649.1 hypothetical protein L325_05680 [Yersinia pestis 9]QOW13143.1 hypothetical protein S96127_0836 [Yersinia pestis]
MFNQLFGDILIAVAFGDKNFYGINVTKLSL